MSFIYSVRIQKKPLMALNIEHIFEKLENNSKKSAQIRILKILFEAKKMNINRGWLYKRDIIKEYCEKYEGANFILKPDKKGKDRFLGLSEEVIKRKYQDWFNGLKKMDLVKSKKIKGKKGSTTNMGGKQEILSLHHSALYGNADTITLSKKHKDEAKNLFEFWLEINKQFDFFPLSGEAEEFIKKIFFDLTDPNDIDWIDISSLRSNLKTESEEKNKLKNNLWKISECIRDSSKINFKCKFKIDGTTETEEIKNFIPFFLKEHKRKWYVFGWNPEETDSFHRNIHYLYDLEESDDRITLKEEATYNKLKKEVKESLVNGLGIYQKWHNSNIKDPKEDTTSNHLTDPLKISFKVKDGDKFDNIKYLKMDPIHSTQDVFKVDESVYSTVTLTCFPDSDLVREIRKIGLHNIIDIKCTWKNGSPEGVPNLDKWVREM